MRLLPPTGIVNRILRFCNTIVCLANLLPKGVYNFINVSIIVQSNDNLRAIQSSGKIDFPYV